MPVTLLLAQNAGSVRLTGGGRLIEAGSWAMAIPPGSNAEGRAFGARK